MYFAFATRVNIKYIYIYILTINLFESFTLPTLIKSCVHFILNLTFMLVITYTLIANAFADIRFFR